MSEAKKAAKVRPKIKSITILLEDGRTKVIDGAALEDPKGGTLVWNDFGAKKVMKAAYKQNGEDHKATKVDEIWDGSGTSSASATELPALMVKPLCDPEGWP
jgi:hypothetical protein